MVVGDVVNEIGGDDAAITFQPAAGVEVLITIIGRGFVDSFFFDDGVITGFLFVLGMIPSTTVIKMPINNAIHLTVVAQGVGQRASFGGIQIQ